MAADNTALRARPVRRSAEQALPEAFRRHLEDFQVVPRLLDPAELTQQRQPPRQRDAAQLLLPEPLRKIVRLAEHREHGVRGVVAAGPGRLAQGVRQPRFVAQPARHVDGADPRRDGGGLVALARAGSGQTGEQANPSRGVLGARGGVGLLEQLHGAAVGADPRPPGVSSSPIAASASSAGWWRSRASRAAVGRVGPGTAAAQHRAEPQLHPALVTGRDAEVHGGAQPLRRLVERQPGLRHLGRTQALLRGPRSVSQRARGGQVPGELGNHSRVVAVQRLQGLRHLPVEPGPRQPRQAVVDGAADQFVGEPVLQPRSRALEQHAAGDRLPDRVRRLPSDVRSPDSVRAMYQHVGSFDALVWAAGEADLGPFDSMSEAEFVLGIESKLLGQIRLVLLGRSLISDGGSFTLVSGYLLDDPVPMGAGFSVANGGVERFVGSAALSFDRGVRINAVSPGLAEDSDEQFARFNPGRILLSPCPPSAPPSSAAWRGGAPEKPSGPGDHVGGEYMIGGRAGSTASARLTGGRRGDRRHDSTGRLRIAAAPPSFDRQPRRGWAQARGAGPRMARAAARAQLGCTPHRLPAGAPRSGRRGVHRSCPRRPALAHPARFVRLRAELQPDDLLNTATCMP